MLIFPPGDLKSVQLSELRLVTGPRIRRETLGSCGALLMRLASIRPILLALSIAAELEGNSAEESTLGMHRRREARKLSLGDAR